MRIGFLGVGRIGRSHAAVVKNHPDVDSLVLGDTDPQRARLTADELACEHVNAVHDIFAAEVDGLVIATATQAHADLIVAGVRAGLPVFCEKPVALDSSENRRVLEEVRAAGTQVQIGFQRRFDRGYRAARDALRNGSVGEVQRVHVVTGDQAPPPAEFIAASGGIFRDCHVHDFDIVRWTTGREFVDVVAVGANRGAEFFRTGGDVDNAAAVLTLDDGTLVTLQGSRYNGAGHDVRMELAGTKATYAVGLDERTPITSTEGTSFPDGDPWPNFWVRFTPAYVAEINAFVAVAQGETESPCTVEDALAALYVAEAAEVSMREGRRVEIAEVAK